MKPKVLVVYDDNTVLTSFAKSVKTAIGAQISTTNSAYVALVSASKNDFDVIFINFSMSGVSGAEFSDKLAAIGVKTPVIMISGTDTDFAELEGFTSTPKTSSPDQLKKVVMENHISIDSKRSI